jgi:hypothetical protein
MKVIRYRGPRATIQAPPGMFFIDFDADSLHLRIASYASQDPFMLEALVKYDETGEDYWKPHIQNTSALFHISPEEAIELMNHKAPEYTFSKNFIYMILNGGDVPALKNAAVSAGLKMNEKEVKFLLDRWLERAVKFKMWRERLVKEAKDTGCITLPSGRRRRFYGIRWDAKSNSMKINTDTLKEIYNIPLIGGEVDVMNPVLRIVWEKTIGTNWLLFDQEHDGFMLRGPKSEAREFGDYLLSCIPNRFTYAPGIEMYIPFSYKGGENWAYLGKVNGD